jgi:hypothetical protein
MLHRVALVRIDVSEELSASFIRVTKIGELGTTQAVTSNRRTLRVYIKISQSGLVLLTSVQNNDYFAVNSNRTTSARLIDA